MPSDIEVRSPYDQSLLAELTYDSEAAVSAKVQRGFELAAARRPLAKTQRLAILESLAQRLHENKEELSRSIAREGGKPLKDARVEADRAQQGVKAAIAALYQWGGHEVPMGLSSASEQRLALTRREARGLVLALSAFNHPLNLIVHQVIPALAVGCPVLIKPAAKTPLTCQRFLDLLYASGLPKEWCQPLLIPNEQSEKLVADPRVAALSFIGSAEVGWRLRALLPPGSHCMLEHGGTAPVIIMDDAALDEAIPTLVRGAFYHAGQVCVSVQNIFVHEKLSEQFAQRFKDATLRLKVGDPLDPDTDVGPLIRAAEVERLERWIKEAQDGGAKVLLRGERWGKQGLSPSILMDAPETSAFYAKELFGPAVGLYRFRDMETVIERLNQSPFAFQASIFTKNLDWALRFAERVPAASVMVNESTTFRTDWMPFAGQRHSGQGTGGILPSMLELSQEKMILIHSKGLNP